VARGWLENRGIVVSMSSRSAGVPDHCFTRAHGRSASNPQVCPSYMICKIREKVA
jgi:hypothetical protein